MKPANTRRGPSYLAITSVVAILAVVSMLMIKSGSKEESLEAVTDTDLKTKTEKVAGGSSPADILESKVDLTGDGQVQPKLEYFQCVNGEGGDSNNIPEVVLLHGAAFTKKNWLESGILRDLCDAEDDEGNRIPSVTALDLTVNANGEQFLKAYEVLVKEKVLSGSPVVVVSPSASGKSVVDLAEMSKSSGSPQILRGWVPVACPAVGSASKTTLEAFKSMKIPILAVYGDQDRTGEARTSPLENYAGAESKILEGRHPAYLDSPGEFVEIFFDLFVIFE
eukprot:CAMPEP_0185738162 /NCGR_PEP_ID=MMETSP1171-20130828/32189_1 /TAXON_ID=374046 /ORGANISM="Helicotheca tamensis, Strain CCMP826" /LENGTH=279 /DNA_ID=CAMNT_0028409289 /DNA_START=8 /DNA_END=845 /DNA_ORIENTATION=+